MLGRLLIEKLLIPRQSGHWLGSSLSDTQKMDHIETHYLQLSPWLAQVSGPTPYGWANVFLYGL